MSTFVNLVVLGVTFGLQYGLAAVGIVLVYRMGRYVNFAHAQLGLVAAALLGKLALEWDLPYWPALLASLAAGVATAAAVERLLTWRLFDASRLVLLLATVGMSQLVLVVVLVGIRPDSAAALVEGYPQPFDLNWQVGSTILGASEIATIVLAPALALALHAFFTRSRLGKVIRAAATNPEAARLAGISVKRISLIVWCVAGFLSSLAAILQAPRQPSGSALIATVGLALLLRALAAALIAGMADFRWALVAGVGIGILEQFTAFYVPVEGTSDLAIALALVVGLVVRRRVLAGAARVGDDRLVLERSRPPLPERVVDLFAFRRIDALGWVGLAVVLAALPVLPWFRSQERAFFLTLILAYAMTGLGAVLLTGWSGQVSLAQFAFLGVGAYTAAHVSGRGFGVPVVLLLSGAVAAAAAAVVGLPALRFRGLFLGVSTLAFAFVANNWLFRQSWVAIDSSGSQSIDQIRIPLIGSVTTQRGLYYVALATLLLVAGGVVALRRSNVGRSLIAVRDNEPLASAHGLTPTTVKLLALALSGFVAGVAGGLWGMASGNWSYQSFDPTMSLVMLSLAIVGGIGRPVGPVLGAFAVFAWPYLVPGANTLAIRLTCAGLLLMVVLFFLPEGIASLLERVRRRLIAWVASGLPEPLGGDPGAPPLVVEGVRLAFDGGPPVLQDIGVQVGDAEIVGIIGSNGAGKSTFLGCVSGHLRPDAGSVRICGTDVTGLSPEYRPWVGASRSFQDAALYPGLTVLETVLVALDRTDRSGALSAAVAAPWVRVAERAKRREALEALDRLGLADRADMLVGELSTGLRRLCDLATVIASKPRLVLLDEPAAGIAQREVEALGPLLRSLRDDLGCSIVVVEHDIPLVMSIADRVYCFADGRVIAEGTPAQIQQDPAVIASYLGASQAALQRSGNDNGTRRRRVLTAAR